MLEAGMEAISDAASAALYGRRQPRNFGKALYQLKDERRFCCWYTACVATFYQDFVVINNTKQYCCFPTRYDEDVIPKYKLCGATIRRGVRWYTIAWGIFFAFLGLIYIILGASLDDGGNYIGLGLLWWFIAAILLIWPIFLARYFTELQVTGDPEDPATPVCGYNSYFLRTFQKPDDDFVMMYVYGALSYNMPGYHALAHLIDDNLVKKVQPRLMSGIQIDADQMPAPPPEPSLASNLTDAHQAKGYGKQLYSIAHTFGLFGADEASTLSKLGTCCVENTARTVFCENLLVMGSEKRILCYPTTYEKLIVPKYRLAKCKFHKGGARSMMKLAWGIFSFGVCLLCTGVSVQSAGNTCKEVCESCSWGSCAYYDCESCDSQIAVGNTLLWCGILLFVLPGIVLLIMACFTSTFQVDLVMGTIRGPKNETFLQAFKRSLHTLIIGPEAYTVLLGKEPDKEFIMEYVYGSLSKNMGGYHALTHLIKDNLIEPPEPRTIMGAIASTGLQAYVPVASTMVDVDHGEMQVSAAVPAAVPAPPASPPKFDTTTGQAIPQAQRPAQAAPVTRTESRPKFDTVTGQRIIYDDEAPPKTSTSFWGGSVNA